MTNNDYQEYKKQLRVADKEFIAEYTRENPDEVKESRLNYLESVLKEKREKWKFWNNESEKYHGWFRDKINKICRDPIKKEADKILKEKEMYLNPVWKISNVISEETIENARQVPLDTLIQFNKAGFATCLWHTEKHASMKYWVKENKVKCFGCGKSADSIEVVRHLYDYDFKNAVNYLNGI